MRGAGRWEEQAGAGIAPAVVLAKHGGDTGGQGGAVAALEPRLGVERALVARTERCVDAMSTGEPGHTWPLPPA